MYGTEPNRLRFRAGALDAKVEITEDLLVAKGIVRRKLDGVRVLAKGEITAALTLSVTGASAPAIAAVEKAGGKLNIKAATAAPVAPAV